ncbi:hypothetical protein N9Y81_05025 [Akkermansiaceae bacterium]|jgi:hypothetical protein|nr:hypothetical protein [Akkermansiaceae bacterium]
MMSSVGLGEKANGLPKSANDLLQAEKRLELTPKQKVKITRIYQWALTGADWLGRDERDQAIIRAKTKNLFERSLKDGLKVLTPKQRKLWQKPRLPEPKVPKKVP